MEGSATTTKAVRRAIQNSQESLRVLSRRYGINQKTVAKWKKRTTVKDLPTGLKEPKSSVLTISLGRGLGLGHIPINLKNSFASEAYKETYNTAYCLKRL
jgi:RNA-directed DNA polymerase